jgi:hypothetical protein
MESRKLARDPKPDMMSTWRPPLGLNRRGLNAGQAGLSESRRDSLGDDEVPFIDEMIDVLLSHLAQFRDQRRDQFRTSTTRAARVLEAIGLAVVHAAI